MDQMQIDPEDIHDLFVALDAWERQPHHERQLLALMEALLSDGSPQERQLIIEVARAEAQVEVDRRREADTILRAKLLLLRDRLVVQQATDQALAERMPHA